MTNDKQHEIMVDSETRSGDSNDALKKAFNLLVQGKRHLLVTDYPSAVQALGETCKIFDDTCGKGADECGEAYLFYGIALLELSRQETGALDGVVNAAITDPSGSEYEEDDDDENNDKEDDSAEPETADESDKKADTEEDIDEDDEKLAKTEKVDTNANLDTINNVNVPGTSKGTISSAEEDQNSDEAEISDLEVAFDVLTMASVIFRRQTEKGNEMKLKLAESLQKLGEVAIEWENNEHAITLLGESLQLRKDCLSEDDRLIAETYYHIGIAYSFMSQVENANDCYRSAIDVITKRIESRKKVMEESDDKEAKSKAETEVWELESLLPEMRMKIEDSQDQMLSTINDAKKKEESEILEEKIVAEKMKEVQAKPVNNVSHLVKRKRKEEPETATKKVCTSIVNHSETTDGNEISSEIKN